GRGGADRDARHLHGLGAIAHGPEGELTSLELGPPRARRRLVDPRVGDEVLEELTLEGMEDAVRERHEQRVLEHRLQRVAVEHLGDVSLLDGGGTRAAHVLRRLVLASLAIRLTIAEPLARDAAAVVADVGAVVPDLVAPGGAGRHALAELERMERLAVAGVSRRPNLRESAIRGVHRAGFDRLVLVPRRTITDPVASRA